jgi:hypothetical protein
VAGSPDAAGGGLCHYGSEPLTVTRCRFESNTVQPFYSVGSAIGYGGGMMCLTAPTTIVDCVFVGNRANFGGGLMTFGPTTVVNCLFTENVSVPQPNDPYPEIGGEGAAIAANAAQIVSADIINCTIADNHGKKYAVYGGWNSTVAVSNSIIWSNTATHPEIAGTYREQIGGSFDAQYSCIGLIFDPAEPGGDPIDPADLPGCIDVAPLLVGGGDYRPAAGSPVIDAGRNDDVPGWVMTDLDGGPRFLDDPQTPDAGDGTAPIVDMGAYEVVPGAGEPADVNGDGGVDVLDLLQLLSAWGACPACPEDIDGDGSVGVLDLLALLAAWG